MKVLTNHPEGLMGLHSITTATGMAMSLSACVAGAPAVSPADAVPVQIDFALTASGAREVPVRAFLPLMDCSPCTAIIFSHGAYAAYDRYDILLNDWAARGYVVIAPQHVDSEEHPDRDAWSMESSRPTRLEDYALISHILAAEGFTLEGLTFSGRQIAAGHSYGGLIAQVAGGASLANPDYALPDTAKSPDAVIALSPPGAIEKLVTMEGFSGINIPMLLVTGTEDVLPGFIDDWQAHLDGYRAAQRDICYALVYDGMDHYFNGAFGRETPDGMTALAQIRDLNARIGTFIKDALGSTLPDGPAWRAQTPPMVEARTRRGDLS